MNLTLDLVVEVLNKVKIAGDENLEYTLEEALIYVEKQLKEVRTKETSL